MKIELTEIKHHLRMIYSAIGIDIPSNNDQIAEFVLQDVKETADPKLWHSGDVAIALRRWIESNQV